MFNNYRRKSTPVKAIKFDERKFYQFSMVHSSETGSYFINTPLGVVMVNHGDYILETGKDKYIIMPAEYFEQNYELINQ